MQTGISSRRYIGRTRLRLLAMILDQPGNPPSHKEMQDAVGYSPHAVQRHMNILRRDGLVSWEPGKSRTLVPTCRFIPADNL